MANRSFSTGCEAPQRTKPDASQVSTGNGCVSCTAVCCRGCAPVSLMEEAISERYVSKGASDTLERMQLRKRPVRVLSRLARARRRAWLCPRKTERRTYIAIRRLQRIGHFQHPGTMWRR